MLRPSASVQRSQLAQLGRCITACTFSCTPLLHLHRLRASDTAPQKSVVELDTGMENRWQQGARAGRAAKYCRRSYGKHVPGQPSMRIFDSFSALVYSLPAPDCTPLDNPPAH